MTEMRLLRKESKVKGHHVTNRRQQTENGELALRLFARVREFRCSQSHSQSTMLSTFSIYVYCYFYCRSYNRVIRGFV